MSLPRERRIPLTQEDPQPEPSGAGLSRRAALQGLAGGIGAALVAAAHPLEAHIAQRAKRVAPPASTPRAPKPQFLDAHQLATLTVLADLIVPGAVASGSPQFIDEVLAIERPDVQREFTGTLGAFDAAAREQHQQPFAALQRDRQIALLEAADAGATVLGDELRRLKTWVAGAHYSSEPGMKELGFTGGMFFTSFPACTHEDGHQ